MKIPDEIISICMNELDHKAYRWSGGANTSCTSLFHGLKNILKSSRDYAHLRKF